MTLEPDPAAVLVHERLQQAISSMRAPDVEAGWAALAAQLEPPIAPVVPLRRPSRGRFVAFAVAAALMVAGSAFAAVRYVGDSATDPVAPVMSPVHASVTGPHAHAPFSGPPAEDRSQPHHEHAGTSHGGTTHEGSPGTGDGGGTSSPSGSGDGTSKPGDDPNDRDQGTGNDGQHNDHGGGNNGAEGTHPSTSGGSSHGGSDH